MVLSVYFRDNLLDLAVGVDEEGVAHGAHVLAAVHGFLLPHAVVLHQFFVFIDQQRKRQLILFRKLLLQEFFTNFSSRILSFKFWLYSVKEYSFSNHSPIKNEFFHGEQILCFDTT